MKQDHIIKLALDDFKNRKYRQPDELYDYVTERIVDDGRYYVLLDEIQRADDFVDVLNGFLHISNVDVYVTGSNSKFLSSDIATEFGDRGDDINCILFVSLNIIRLAKATHMLLGMIIADMVECLWCWNELRQPQNSNI